MYVCACYAVVDANSCSNFVENLVIMIYKFTLLRSGVTLSDTENLQNSNTIFPYFDDLMVVPEELWYCLLDKHCFL